MAKEANISINSRQLHNIESFASDSGINVMIINSQAFAAKGKDARRIYMELDDFQSRKPIDVIAGTNPILIIDEPQRVEGEKDKRVPEGVQTAVYTALFRNPQTGLQQDIPSGCHRCL